MNEDQEVRMRVRQILKEVPFTLTDAAERADLSYAALHSWNHTDRVPRASSRQKLAKGIRSKAEELQRLADELEAL